MSYKEKLANAIVPAFLLSFTFFVFGTIELYMTNANEFWFDYSAVLGPILIAGIILTFAISLILSLVSRKAYFPVIGVMYAIAILVYVQGNFLPNNYGTLNGTEIDWTSYSGRAVINSVIWIAVIAAFLVLSIKLKDKYISILKVAAFVIIATQIVTLTTLFIGNNNKQKVLDGYLSTKDEFKVSSNSNTIVLLLDAFDSQVFCDLMDDYPDEMNETFEDFTFYHNTVGGATRTKYAIPYIFGSITNTKDQSYISYLSEAYEASALFKELREGNYSATLYTEPSFVDLNQTSAIDNLVGGKPQISSSVGLASDFIKLTAFRYAPHLLKKYFWMYSGDFDKWKRTSTAGKINTDPAYSFDDVKFYNELCNGLSIGTDKNAFRFYHLDGAHAPYTMNESIQRLSVNEQSNEENQALGCTRIVREYIEQLKKLNVYDKSTIIVMADHGCERGVEQNPLFLVKEAGDDKELTVSDTAISYKDLSRMLSEAVSGKDINIESNYAVEDARYFYSESDLNGNVNIKEYRINGKAYDYDACEATGVEYHGDSKSQKDYKYKLGTELSFGLEATANNYTVSGFSKNEGDHTWTDGNEAVIKFQIDDIDSNYLMLGFVCTPYGSSQRVNIFANEKKVDSLIVSGASQRYYVIIPVSYMQNGTVILKLELPDAITPGMEDGAGMHNDGRTVALSMESITLSETEYDSVEASIAKEYVIGTKLLFNSETPASEQYCYKGFSTAEDWGIWLDGNEAEMIFMINEAASKQAKDQPKGDFNVQLDIAHTFNGDQKLILSANEEKVTDTTITEEGVLNFKIPRDVITSDSLLKLTFEMPDAVSPAEINGSSDNRVLSIGLRSLTITE